MTRISIPSRDEAPEASKPLLDAVHAQLGVKQRLDFGGLPLAAGEDADAGHCFCSLLSNQKRLNPHKMTCFRI